MKDLGLTSRLTSLIVKKLERRRYRPERRKERKNSKLQEDSTSIQPILVTPKAL